MYPSSLASYENTISKVRELWYLQRKIDFTLEIHKSKDTYMSESKKKIRSAYVIFSFGRDTYGDDNFAGVHM